MITRYKIMLGANERLDIAEGLPFSIDGVHYPRNWLSKGLPVSGFTVEAYDATPPAVTPSAPNRVTKLQLVRALRVSGQWGTIKAALMQADVVTKEDWEYAGVINRTDPVALTFAAALGLTDAEIDALFVAGAAL